LAKGFDVAIIGGGIIGVSAAAFMAEAGLSVRLFERAAIAAAASGRNSGAIQHPFDPVLAELHTETLAIYRDLAARAEGTDFHLPEKAHGLLLLSAEKGAVEAAAEAIAGHSPELKPSVIGATELSLMEPALAADLQACRIETGYPVAPAAATQAMAARAAAAGATIAIGDTATVAVRDGRAVGVRLGERVVDAALVLVAAGPWTASLVPGWSARPPIMPVWGVVVSAALQGAPHAVLEELGIDRPGPTPDELFSLVTAGPDTSVGSTFLTDQPDPAVRVEAIVERAARFVPALRDARRVAVRACARPASFDGRPLIGSVPSVDGLFVCAGHGPWGMSTGPASARLVVDEMLGRGSVPEPLSAGRA
jgi:glycine/D-amino acid oxidase-like deaminating enzyme